jgi:hypothetical protein
MKLKGFSSRVYKMSQNNKNRLQEHTVKNRLAPPRYESHSSGEPHEPSWTSTVWVGSRKASSGGAFLTKASAEMDAARRMLENLIDRKDTTVRNGPESHGVPLYQYITQAPPESATRQLSRVTIMIDCDSHETLVGDIYRWNNPGAKVILFSQKPYHSRFINIVNPAGSCLSMGVYLGLELAGGTGDMIMVASLYGITLAYAANATVHGKKVYVVNTFSDIMALVGG